MNIAFYILLIIGIVLIWFLLAGIFKPIGKWVFGLYKDVEDVMTETEDEIRKED